MVEPRREEAGRADPERGGEFCAQAFANKVDGMFRKPLSSISEGSNAESKEKNSW